MSLAKSSTMNFRFDNTYVRLPERFYSHQMPEPVPNPRLIRVNHQLADLLGIDPQWLGSEEGISVIAGNSLPIGADPIATVYAGHQFGSWNPQLGDGRALLLGEVLGTDGERYDIQLKGSGQTPYSRMGDGRAPLGPVLREYIVSEAMARLGINTTRVLAAVTSGSQVIRETPLPGGLLVRVAKSHIRIGTLEFFAARQDFEALQLLVNHVIQRHYPAAADARYPALSLFEMVMAAQAKLVANWQGIGFIHGVMNTDNTLLSGETIDYGPCAFMDTYHPARVYSSIDHQGRYAYRNQPGITHWNMACLGQVLVPLIGDDEKQAVELVKESLQGFAGLFLEENINLLSSKLGLAQATPDDEVLVRDFLNLLESSESDFTLAFRRLSELANPEDGIKSIRELFDFTDDFTPWLTRWRKRMAHKNLALNNTTLNNTARQPDMESTPDTEARQQMLLINPVLIPRNHLIEEVITAATNDGNFAPFHKLMELLDDPFNYHKNRRKYASPPLPEQVVQQTFCGT